MLAGAAVSFLAVAVGLSAQTEFNNNIKYNAGQGSQPVFEGWS